MFERKRGSVMGASSDGYTVRSGMSGQAKELDGAGDDAGHIHEAIVTDQCYGQDALGGAESAEAFDAFAAAWLEDASTLQSALHELAGKVRLAKSAYRGSDHTVATRTAAVSVGGDGNTTLPVPGGRPSALTTF
ncbi:hypothetical protein [Streptomyces barringtoniae]|uniref:hypothetical protein n=1 Tax=Streptomyces barringtoniae TaxID=2892029 RepID=UPI001E4EDC18|nr:hypothetical protein [Streptomyces barringtoniae]MCC5478707.1 hypothetical protein [Streptomyces barringtoniae]